MRLRICAFWLGFFGGIAANLILLEFLDLIITSLFFIVTGEFSSILHRGYEFATRDSLFKIFQQDFWQLSTPLKGLDRFINWFIRLQYESSGRWLMIALSAIGFGGTLLCFDISKDKDDVGVDWAMFGYIAAVPVICPIAIGGFFGSFGQFL